MIELLCI